MRIDLQENNDHLDVPMAPLIDVVFLLLIFFLVASQFKDVRRELQINLPQATAAAEVVTPDDLFVIALDQDGQAHVSHEPVTMAVLIEQIRARAQRQPDLRVRIDADRQTPYHHVVQVLNELQFHGYTRVGLQTRAQ